MTKCLTNHSTRTGAIKPRQPVNSNVKPQVFRMFKFEWDDQKATGNLPIHGVSFDEAVSVFGDGHQCGQQTALGTLKIVGLRKLQSTQTEVSLIVKLLRLLVCRASVVLCYVQKLTYHKHSH